MAKAKDDKQEGSDIDIAPRWAQDPRGKRPPKPAAYVIPVKLVKCAKCGIKVVEDQRFGHVLRCPQMDLQALFVPV